MTQIATNIEQSKHLFELGLSHETADMFIENGVEITFNDKGDK